MGDDEEMMVSTDVGIVVVVVVVVAGRLVSAVTAREKRVILNVSFRRSVRTLFTLFTGESRRAQACSFGCAR